MNRRNSLSILPIFILFFFTQTRLETPNDNTSNQKNQKNYKLNETEARKKINKDLIKKFGETYSLFLSYLRLSKEEIEKIKLNNQEIKDLEKIREEELAADKNYKITIIKVPILRRDFKDKEKKEYSMEKLNNNTVKKIVEYISKKSQSYALLKTESENIAKKIKSQISKELTEKINTNSCSLKEYISKTRELRIDNLINTHIDKDNTNKINKKRKKVAFVRSKIRKNSKNFTLYISQQCPVCHKSFKYVKRMFLLPCGHNICENCLNQYSSKCPVCGKKIEESTPE